MCCRLKIAQIVKNTLKKNLFTDLSRDLISNFQEIIIQAIRYDAVSVKNKMTNEFSKSLRFYQLSQ